MPFITMMDDNLSSLKELTKQGKVNFDWSLKSSPKAKTIILVNDGEIRGLVEFQKEVGAHKMWLIEVVLVGNCEISQLTPKQLKTRILYSFGSF